MEELNEWIETELPNEGEWYKDGAKAFKDAAYVMHDLHEIPVQEVKDMFDKMYSAVADEFGG